MVLPFDVDVAAASAVSELPIEIPAGAVRITVDEHGFSPARVEARAGLPLTLAVERAGTPNCGSQIVFPALGLKRDLPVGRTTLIPLPSFTGDLSFTCGMGMYRRIVVAVPSKQL